MSGLRRALPALLTLLATAAGLAQTPAYTVSVVPQFPRLVLFEDWQPLLDRLGQELGVTFELRVEDDIPSFEQAFLAATPDFAFMNPYHAVMAHQAHGYLPLISDASRQLRGILVVRDDSPYRAVADLDGAEIAFPSPNAFGASLYMRALLAEREDITVTPRYVDTHSNAYRHVFLGFSAAGGGVMNTLLREPEALQATLRVIYQTPGVTPHPLTAHPRVPEALRERLVATLLALAADEEGRTLLRNVQLAEPMRVDYPTHYRPLEDLRLDTYLVVPEN